MRNKIIILGIVALFICLAISPAVNSEEIIKINNNGVETALNQTDTKYYAILAACAQYKDTSSNLPIGEYKLEKLYRGLISNDNWKDENIILLVNDNADPTNPGYEGGATKANIIKALEEMAGKVTENDVFVFSWQGHGSEVPESQTSGDNDDSETDGYDEVICPWDCEVNDDETLINYISDDDLDYYFSQINADGMLLIFESCLSGGLIGNNNGDKIISSDIDRPGRIVIVSTLDGTLGRASWIFGFPMTWTLGDAFDKNSLLGGPADEGTITAEDAFYWARPKVFAENSILWVGMWTFFFIIEYENQKNENGLDTGAAIKAAIEATKLVFFEFCLLQLIAILKSGGSGVLNWPHMVDNYPLVGNEELIIVNNEDSGGYTNKENVNIPLMPEIWLKPDYEEYSIDFRDDIPLNKYEKMSWFDWENIKKDSWPPLQIEASYEGDNSDKSKIYFTAEASNGPREFTYNWDFGDETTSNEQNPIHNYEKHGQYNVELNVFDNAERKVEYKINKLEISKSNFRVIELLQRFPFLQNLLNFLL